MFETYTADDLRDLIHEFPLAWLCAQDGQADHASLLPLIGGYDDDGRLTHLIGHMARANPLFAALTAKPAALILFKGPDSYISPEQAGVRNWAPTWIYAQVRIEADITFEPDGTGAALDTLIDAMEVGQADPWRSAELGARYDPMLTAIIGFRADVTRLAGKFKLGQDERPETLDRILQSLDDPAMIRWIRRFNPEKA